MEPVFAGEVPQGVDRVEAAAAPAPVAEEEEDATLDIPSPFAAGMPSTTPDAEATQPINVAELRAAEAADKPDAGPQA